ncbi:HAMP domain-containing protein [Nostoc sp. FACHB-87]|uniref:sensor histidine kinase n=1 Tax=Nostocaceae TaxID=1162 RepID=UPI001685B918|nr:MULTISPECIES: ATP-binding protein [Nostocaceae]MBD2455108.1 HAMP domain-containing protein [Nostoc sp. FACHB-87]MBD2477885.1 HAMP domain-containing protein [Anabaena sp. FACHB-83]
MRRNFRFRLNLSQKIVFSFLAVFLSIFIFCLLIIGHWFTNSLEQNLRQEVAIFAARVHTDFLHEQEDLETQVNLIAGRETIHLAIEQKDTAKLLQDLLPIRTALEIDWIKVVDPNSDTLVEIKHASLNNSRLLDKAITNLASSGSILNDFVDVEGSSQVLQVTILPIKSAKKIIGGIIIGNLVDESLLEQIAIGSTKQIVSTKNDIIIASTIPEIKLVTWQPPSPDSSTSKVVINQQEYFAKSILFKGGSQSLTTTVLYPILKLETTQDALWIRLEILFFLGGTLVTLIGYFISQKITRPLQAVTKIAKKVTEDADFDLQAPVTTQDEVGVLAISLNQLIQQVKQLLTEQYAAKDKLEAYSQNLEEKIKERTQEVERKNRDLKNTLNALKQTQAQLIQTEKMSSLGQLVAGVAHEINNPVTFIYGNVGHAENYVNDILNLIQLYQQSYPYPEAHIQDVMEEVDIEYILQDLPKILTSMKVGAERIHQIVLSLRIFSRLDEAEFKSANVHDGIDSTLLILRHRLKAQSHRPEIQVIKDYCEMPEIKCFAGQLNQVFMNILANAIDAVEEAWEKSLCSQPIIRISSECDQENIRIHIADNGTGIPQEIQRRLFDPFFTTKPIGKGTGLGLSISYQIVNEKHRGSLQCISLPGTGTEFVITIPIR